MLDNYVFYIFDWNTTDEKSFLKPTNQNANKIYFIKQDYKEVEITLTKLISYQYSNDDWNTKAMALFH